MRHLNALEREFINRFQGGFPLARRPFAEVGALLGSDEATLLATLERLLAEGWLSRFGPLYQAERLGGALLLAAMQVPEMDFERVAAQVNAFPEVAHNYRREHRLNLWPVLATDSPAALERAIAAIESVTGLPLYRFPKEREYYLGLWLELDAQGGVRTRPVPEAPGDQAYQPHPLDGPLIAATQAGLPLTLEPYATLAARLGSSPDQVVERFQHLLAAGLMRRIGLVPNHYRLGLRANGMSVWDIQDQDLDAIGGRLGQLDYISHCYARPRRLPQWPYNLFAMVHGRERSEVLAKVADMERLVGARSRGHDILFSTSVLKKTGWRGVNAGV